MGTTDCNRYSKRERANRILNVKNFSRSDDDIDKFRLGFRSECEVKKDIASIES